jgi:hypothetical protein
VAGGTLGPVRETVGMICQTCGTDYAAPASAGEPKATYEGLIMADDARTEARRRIAEVLHDHRRIAVASTVLRMVAAAMADEPNRVAVDPEEKP